MILNKVEIKSSSNYYLSKKPDSLISEIWIICHGYGQLAKDFLSSFASVFESHILFIAPEAPNQFYLKGSRGKVGSSWMTKENRYDDINNYIKLLDEIYFDVLSKLETKVKINILGFSQGTATVCRWINASQPTIETLILWGGGIPEDVIFFKKYKHFNNLSFKIVLGNNDKYYNEDLIILKLNELDKNNIKYTLIRYEGGHIILKDALKKVFRQPK